MAAGTLQGEPFGSGGRVVTAVVDPLDQVSVGHVVSQCLIREGQLSPCAAFSYSLLPYKALGPPCPCELLARAGATAGHRVPPAVPDSTERLAVGAVPGEQH